jgi:hypothetical protein
MNSAHYQTHAWLSAGGGGKRNQEAALSDIDGQSFDELLMAEIPSEVKVESL